MNFKFFVNFFSQFYERIIALLVMFLLVVFSGWLVFRVANIEHELTREETAKSQTPLKPPDFGPLSNSLARLENPPQWTTNADHRLFIAPLMKVFPGKFTPEAWNPKSISVGVSREGIEIKWLRQYGFPINKPIGDLDPDGDSFTNLEEYKAGTDPTDPASHPDIAVKLRLFSINPQTFPFVFTAIEEVGEKKSFSIQRRDGRKTYFVKLDEVIPDRQYPGWKIIKFEEKSQEQLDLTIKGPDGSPLKKKVEVSELTVQKEGGSSVIMIKGKEAKTDEFSAKLYYILEKKWFDVQVGQIFVLRDFLLQDIQYQVISIKKLDDGKPEVIVKAVEQENVEKEAKPIILLLLRPEEIQKPQPTPTKSTQPGQPLLPPIPRPTPKPHSP